MDSSRRCWVDISRLIATRAKVSLVLHRDVHLLSNNGLNVNWSNFSHLWFSKGSGFSAFV